VYAVKNFTWVQKAVTLLYRERDSKYVSLPMADLVSQVVQDIRYASLVCLILIKIIF